MVEVDDYAEKRLLRRKVRKATAVGQMMPENG